MESMTFFADKVTLGLVFGSAPSQALDVWRQVWTENGRRVVTLSWKVRLAALEGLTCCFWRAVLSPVHQEKPWCQSHRAGYQGERPTPYLLLVLGLQFPRAQLTAGG